MDKIPCLLRAQISPPPGKERDGMEGLSATVDKRLLPPPLRARTGRRRTCQKLTASLRPPLAFPPVSQPACLRGRKEELEKS